MVHFIRVGLASSVATVALALSAPAMAQAPVSSQEASADDFGDIVVTAERRETSLSRTPIAITALSGNDLKARNIVSAADLQQSVPALQIGRFGALTRISLRGVGMENFAGGSIGGDSGVSFNVDGVPYGRPQMFTPGFFDLKSIEVLRGPQGTLYGRNATGGAINITTNQPTDELEGYANAALGTRNLARGEVAVGGPVSEGVLNARIALRFNDQDGYLKNVTTGNNIGSLNERQARLQLAFMPGRPFSIALSGDYYRNDGTGNVERTLPSVLGLTLTGVNMGGNYVNDKSKVAYTNDGFTHSRVGGTSIKLRGELPGFNAEWITAYREMTTRDNGDLDGTSANFIGGTKGRVNKAHAVSSQLNLASSTSGPLQWVAGGLYVHEKGTGVQTFDIAGFGTLIQGGDVKTNAWALYGQASYELLDGLTLTAGGRYSHEKKSSTDFAELGARAQASGEATWHAFTPRATINWQVTGQTLAYVTVARGFKSGGFNIGALQGQAYAPEYVWDYEGGIKTRFDGGRGSVSLAAYHYDYSDMQITQILGLAPFIVNAGKSKINGVELETRYQISDPFEVSLNYAYTHARFSRFFTIEDENRALGLQSFAGNIVPNIPTHTLDVGASYRAYLAGGNSLTFRGDVSYRSKTYFLSSNRDYAAQDAYAIANARISFAKEGSGFSTAAFVRNLTNKIVYTGIQVNSGILDYSRLAQQNEARIFGLEFGYKF